MREDSNLNLIKGLTHIEDNLKVLNEFKSLLNISYANVKANIDNQMDDNNENNYNDYENEVELELKDELTSLYTTIEHYIEKLTSNLKKSLELRNKFYNLEIEDLNDYSQKYLEFKEKVNELESDFASNYDSILIKLTLYKDHVLYVQKSLKIGSNLDVKEEVQSICKESKHYIDTLWPELYIQDNKFLTQLIIRASDIYDNLETYKNKVLASEDQAEINRYYNELLEELKDFYSLPDIVKNYFEDAEILSGLS